MSEYTAAAAGTAALDARDWDTAITKLTQALKSARSPKWLIARSRAHIGKGDFANALRDAEYAHAAAAARGNRDLIRESQYRRAVAHFRLGEYGNADACARWAQGLVEGKQSSDPEFKNAVVNKDGFAIATRTQLEAGMRLAEEHRKNKEGGIVGDKSPRELNAACALRLQILSQMDKLAADDEKRRVTVKFAPSVSMDNFAAGEEAAREKTTGKEVKDEKKVEKEEVKAAAAESVRRAPPAQTDVRVDFFQSNNTVSVSVFAKGVPKDEFKVEYGEQELRMSHIPGHEPWYTIPLWGTIDPAGSKHTVTANKVEFQLKKAEVARWPALRRDPSAAATKAPEPAAPVAAPAAAAAPAKTSEASGPSYPTSSKSGAKNWDTVLADENDEDEKDINAFFKTLYKGATPEQQRAMMKSFTESNGTALSTDWDDVKGRTVQTQPPEGVEAKKWEA
ncbi:CS domain-containing protein [Colletotrichum karsti]|uniref:CS domain-containing protein n=1 Tax=Colletotrichum karsti TaxID=1095194 RepID=A0A9P6I490_9PEZI|nr:CS domain-containing protein [Colletotrichum karsti]KAF9877058.1 CS domain-containing protein [Colletotrichum karsti]